MRRVPREPMSPVRHSHIRRRNKLVNPRLQAGPAIVIAAGVLVAGTAVALLLFRNIGQALRDASYGGHFVFPSPFSVVDDCLVRWLLGLFLVVFLGGALVFCWHVHRVRQGISRLVEVFEASCKGDLSSAVPPGGRGLGEIRDLGREIGEVRSHTLALVREIRKEAEAMRTSALSEEEFARRWEGLRNRIREIVP